VILYCPFYENKFKLTTIVSRVRKWKNIPNGEIRELESTRLLNLKYNFLKETIASILRPGNVLYLIAGAILLFLKLCMFFVGFMGLCTKDLMSLLVSWF
jgi:hypothetical protein